MDMKRILLNRVVFVASALTFMVGFQNCSDVAFNTQLDVSSTCSPDAADDCHQSTETLRKIQPAVAVRGISCLMCHAQIQANVITDFGHGSPWYFNSGGGINDQSWFNNYVNSWQHAVTVVGSVIVPNATIPTSIQNSVTAFAGLPPMTIKQMMSTPYQAPNNWGENEPYEGQVEMTYKIAPPAGQPKVIEKSNILITAPTEADITALAPNLWQDPSASGVARVGSSAPVTFTQVGSGTSSYTVNDEASELQCVKANIVIKGTLLLRKFKVNAAGGCKLYVSGSVFIEDGITYGSGADQSLQITSANGIFLGFNTNTLSNRLVHDARNPKIDGPRAYTARASQAVAEAQAISSLNDAQENNGGDCVNNGRGKCYKVVNFSGLLLNAPMIHSRYLGVFKGTIVAELALFNLGNFHFEFDPVLNKVNAFPLLKNPILIAK